MSTPVEDTRQGRRTLFIALTAVVLGLAFVAWRVRGGGGNFVSPDDLPKTDAPAAAAAPVPVTTGEPTTPTLQLPPGSTAPGPAPAGKEWSAEHGHWHDTAPTGQPIPMTPGADGSSPLTMQPMPMTLPAQGTPGPQPDGPAPAGKVWSADHGHWHDDPAAAPPGGATMISPEGGAPVMMPAPTPGPQPPGPVPAGKTWSAEHGHWHDDPAATPAVPANPEGGAPKP